MRGWSAPTLPLATLPVPVSTYSVLFPTDGKPTNPTVAIPVLATSKPTPGPPPLLAGAISSRFSLASLALN